MGGLLTTTEVQPPKAPQRPRSKELRELGRKLKQGFRWERTGSDHYRLRDRDGKLVEFRGRPIEVSQNPSPGVVNAIIEQLTEVQALKGTKIRPTTPEGVQRRKDAQRQINEDRQRSRQAEATARLQRFAAVFNRMNGLTMPGLSSDIGHVGALLLRDMPTNGSKRIKTPDLLTQNALRVINGAWVEPEYAAVWDHVIGHLEAAPDPVGEWFNLVREARGLPADTVEVRLPKGAESDWPFRVELIPLSALLVDESYQRPVDWPFVRKESARYDSTLVGTIDVAQRSPSQFAILDGQQRSQIVRLVGKSTIWASVYVGLDPASEARFFLHKNANRKSVHPWYTFRALVASGDEDAGKTQEIVESHGYVLAIAAPNSTAARERNISAISAVTSAYARKTPDGLDCLDPTLDVLKRSTLGRDHGQDSILIRGMSLVFEQRPAVDRERLVDLLSEIGPTLIIGRARDAHGIGRSAADSVARVVLSEHDRRARRRAAS
jgi:hypothetical protein